MEQHLHGLTLADVRRAYETPLHVEIIEPSGERRVTTVDVWNGGLSPEALFRQAVIGDRMAQSLWAWLRDHPAYDEWREAGRAEFEWLLSASTKLPAPMNNPRLYGVIRSGEVELRTRLLLMDALHLAFQYNGMITVEGKFSALAPHESVRSLLRDEVDEWYPWSGDILREVGVVPDRWHRIAAMAHLLEPRLAPYVIVLPFWIGDPDVPGEPATRQAGTAVGVGDETERVAARMKQDWRRRVGHGPLRAKPGPKPGSRQTPSRQKAALDRYLRERSDMGVSTQMIAEDHTAQALYRSFKSDHAAELNERVVAARLRATQRK